MRAIRLTPYRAAVLRALRTGHAHSTAAEIYRLVRRRRPGVAFATIYNALNWLTGCGLAAELKFGHGASRYDPIIRSHDYLVCTSCGALVDYEVALSPKIWLRAGRRQGFRVHRYRLELFGLCPRCQTTEKAHRLA